MRRNVEVVLVEFRLACVSIWSPSSVMISRFAGWGAQTMKAHSSKLAESPQPEMLRLSLSDLALRIKIMNIKIGDSIEDVLSRAMYPPSQLNIQRAIASLVEVRAL